MDVVLRSRRNTKTVTRLRLDGDVCSRSRRQQHVWRRFRGGACGQYQVAEGGGHLFVDGGVSGMDDQDLPGAEGELKKGLGMGNTWVFMWDSGGLCM